MSYPVVAMRRRSQRVGRGRRSAISTRRGSRTRRNTTWIRSGASGGAFTFGNCFAGLLFSDTDLDPGARLGATITRVRLALQVDVSAPAAPVADGMIYVGLYVGAPQDPTVYPKPGDQRNEVDWFLWQAWAPSQVPFMLDVGGTPGTNFLISREFDVKSQRKFYFQDERAYYAVQPGNMNINSVRIESSVLVKTE